jgi:hypothetical protein
MISGLDLKSCIEKVAVAGVKIWVPQAKTAYTSTGLVPGYFDATSTKKGYGSWIRKGHTSLRLVRQWLRLLKLVFRRRSDAERIVFEFEIISPYLKWQTGFCNRLSRLSQFRISIDDGDQSTTKVGDCKQVMA